MRIAVISDIHDNIWNLHAALHWLSGREGDDAVQELICCGDLCSPFVMGILVSYCQARSIAIHAVYGNNDGDTSRITAQVQGWPGLHIYNEFAELAVGGESLQPRAAFKNAQGQNTYFEATAQRDRIAIQHYDAIARPLALSGLYRLVCFGHNHRLEMTRFGETLALNPGTLMGYNPLAPGVVKDVDATFAVYDTASHDAHLFWVAEPWRSPDQTGQVLEKEGTVE
jgi:putative phosphoesterase